MAAGDLGEAVPGARRRRRGHLDLREQLVGLERGGQEAADEVLGAARPRAARALRRWKTASRAIMQAGSSAAGIGVGQAAPDGAARPGLQVTDERRRLGEQRRGGGDAPVALERVLANERAQAEAPVLRSRPRARPRG